MKYSRFHVSALEYLMLDSFFINMHGDFTFLDFKIVLCISNDDDIPAYNLDLVGFIVTQSE